jgi:hypothetical protein
VLRRGCDIVDNADTTAGGAPPSFTARVLRVLALTTLFVAAALLLWVAADIVLLAFIGFLLAVALATPASAIARRTGMPRWLALLLVALAILALLAGGAWFAGDQIVQQIVGLIEDLPAIAERLRDTLERVPGGDWLRDQLEDVEPMGLADLDLGLVGQVTGSLAALFEVLVRITFVVFFALFLASAPQRYRDGLVRLSPPASQARAREVYDQIAVTMQGWIVGQLASMLLVGILATVGLLVIGVPYALLEASSAHVAVDEERDDDDRRQLYARRSRPTAGPSVPDPPSRRSEEAREHHRQRLGRAARQHQGEQVLVPGEDEREDGHAGHAGRRRRQHDEREALEAVRAVDGCRVVDVGGDVVEERLHQPDHQRQVDEDVHDTSARWVPTSCNRTSMTNSGTAKTMYGTKRIESTNSSSGREAGTRRREKPYAAGTPRATDNATAASVMMTLLRKNAAKPASSTRGSSPAWA